MRMTRLEWRYLQKIALDHPYYDTHKLPLTESEAEAIIREQVTRTGKEFVDSIYSQLGMSRPEKQKNRFTWAANVVSLFRVPPIRKIVAVALALLLLTVFFAATPTGRAVAESVIQYIVQLLDDGRLVINQNVNESPIILVNNENESIADKQDFEEDDVVHVKSFKDFTRTTEKTPLMLMPNPSELYYIYDQEVDYIELHSTYDTPRGKIITAQIWDAESLISVTLTGYSMYNESLYYSIEESGDIYCIKVLEDSTITIMSNGNYTVDEMFELLNGK